MFKVRFCNNIWLGLEVVFFLIQSNNLQLLINVFRPFLFSVSIDMVGFRCAILLLVFYSLSFSTCLLDYLNIYCHYIFISLLAFYYISLYNFYSCCFRSCYNIHT